jgi:O-antigen ligase
MITYKNIYILFVVFSLFGYSLSAGVSEMLSVPADSPLVSVLFRGFTLGLTFLFIFNILKNGKFSNKIELFLLTLFLSFYSFRLYVDLNIYSIYIAIPKNQYYLFYFLILFLPSFLILSQRFPLFDINKFLKYLKYMIFSALLLNVLFGFQDYLKSIALGLTTIRIETNKLNPISLGHLAVSVLIYLLYIKFFLEAKFTFFEKIILVIALIALALANSKGPMLTFVIVYFYAIYLRYNFGTIMLKNIIYFFLAILVLAALLNYVLDVNIFNRFESMFNDTETSTTSRLSSYQDGINLFLLNPIFGTSIVTSAGGYPHNIIVEILMSMGLFGFILFFSLLALTFKSISIINHKQSEFVIFGLLFLQYLLAFQTSGAFWEASSLFILMSIIFSIKNKLRTAK